MAGSTTVIVMTARESFGPALRSARERRGLTLSALAAQTKISPHLLRSLERGDVSGWPGGIYRRSFVRAYAAAVGLPPEPTLGEFLRLFPEPGQSPPAILDDDDPRRLRLSLVSEPRWKTPALRSVVALVDAGVVLFVGDAASSLAGAGFWTSAALAALAYHAIGAILVGRSPGAWIVSSGVALPRPAARTMQDQLANLRHGWLRELAIPATPPASAAPQFEAQVNR